MGTRVARLPGTLTVTVLLLVIGSAGLPGAASAQPGSASVPLTLNIPEPHAFSLALDEIELDWSRHDPARVLSSTANPIAQTRVSVEEKTRAVFALESVADVAALVAVGNALEAANPGAEANFVLYEPGERSASSRLVLTTRTALLLDDPRDPTGALTEYSARNPVPISAVPGGYVLEASDPLSAVQLADALRVRAGVKSAYPLLERQVFGR